MSNRIRANLIVALGAVLLLTVSVALATTEIIPDGAKRLPSMIESASVIVVAEFKESKALPNSKFYANLQFRIVRTIQGDPQVKTVLVPAFIKSIRYGTLHGAKRAILFLKKGKDDKLELAGHHSYLRIEGDDAVKEVEQYITLRRDQFKVKNGRQAYWAFVIDKVATSKSEYFRESMAQDLSDPISGPIFGLPSIGGQRPKFNKQDTDAIAKAALNETSFPVATRLCLILEALGSDKTDDCIVHALLDTPPGKFSHPLAGIIARRDQLFQRLLPKLEDKEFGRFYFIFNHVSLVPDAKLLPGLRRIWEKNPQARPAIKRVLNSGRNWERRVLLRELEPLSGSTPLQRLKLADHVVLARYVKDEYVPGISLTFKVDRAIKPTKIPRSFKIASGSFKTAIRNNLVRYDQVIYEKPVLLMLKQDEKGAFAVLHALDDKSVKEGLESLVPIIERYLKIIALKNKPYADAMKAFVFEGLQHEDGTIAKRGAAFELADLFKNHRKLITIDNEEHEQLTTIIQQSKDSRVAFPMCYALSQGGESKSIDDACLHTIVEIADELQGMYELYSAVAKRKSLRLKLFNKALQEKDEVKLYRIIDHLTAIQREERVRDQAKIWKQNKAAHTAIAVYSSRLSKEDQVLFGLLTECPLRKWTNNTGLDIEARLVDFENGKVSIGTKNGRIIDLPLSRISKADQEYVKKTLPESFPQKPTPKKPAPK